MESNTETSYVPHLVAKVDPRNQASEKIVRRVGAREGEVLGSVGSPRGFLHIIWLKS